MAGAHFQSYAGEDVASISSMMAMNYPGAVRSVPLLMMEGSTVDAQAQYHHHHTHHQQQQQQPAASAQRLSYHRRPLPPSSVHERASPGVQSTPAMTLSSKYHEGRRVEATDLRSTETGAQETTAQQPAGLSAGRKQDTCAMVVNVEQHGQSLLSRPERPGHSAHAHAHAHGASAPHQDVCAEDLSLVSQYPSSFLTSTNAEGSSMGSSISQRVASSYPSLSSTMAMLLSSASSSASMATSMGTPQQQHAQELSRAHASSERLDLFPSHYAPNAMNPFHPLEERHLLARSASQATPMRFDSVLRRKDLVADNRGARDAVSREEVLSSMALPLSSFSLGPASSLPSSSFLPVSDGTTPARGLREQYRQQDSQPLHLSHTLPPSTSSSSSSSSSSWFSVSTSIPAFPSATSISSFASSSSSSASPSASASCSAPSSTSSLSLRPLQFGAPTPSGRTRKRRLCREEGCEKRAKGSGVCIKHGAQVKRCGVPHCQKYPVSEGLCISHGGQARRCRVPLCDRYAKMKGFCKRHAAGLKSGVCVADSCAMPVFELGLCQVHRPQPSAAPQTPQTRAPQPKPQPHLPHHQSHIPVLPHHHHQALPQAQSLLQQQFGHHHQPSEPRARGVAMASGALSPQPQMQQLGPSQVCMVSSCRAVAERSGYCETHATLPMGRVRPGPPGHTSRAGTVEGDYFMPYPLQQVLAGSQQRSVRDSNHSNANSGRGLVSGTSASQPPLGSQGPSSSTSDSSSINRTNDDNHNHNSSSNNNNNGNKSGEMRARQAYLLQHRSREMDMFGLNLVSGANNNPSHESKAMQRHVEQIRSHGDVVTAASSQPQLLHTEKHVGVETVGAASGEISDKGRPDPTATDGNHYADDGHSVNPSLLVSDTDFSARMSTGERRRSVCEHDENDDGASSGNVSHNGDLELRRSEEEVFEDRRQIHSSAAAKGEGSTRQGDSASFRNTSIGHAGGGSVSLTPGSMEMGLQSLRRGLGGADTDSDPKRSLAGRREFRFPADTLWHPAAAAGEPVTDENAGGSLGNLPRGCLPTGAKLMSEAVLNRSQQAVLEMPSFVGQASELHSGASCFFPVDGHGFPGQAPRYVAQSLRPRPADAATYVGALGGGGLAVAEAGMGLAREELAVGVSVGVSVGGDVGGAVAVGPGVAASAVAGVPATGVGAGAGVGVGSHLVTVSQAIPGKDSGAQGPVACSVPGCSKRASSLRRQLCSSHGGSKKKKCSVAGCENRAKNGAVCISHGAQVKRCNAPNCTKYPVKGGLCIAHGGQARRCRMQGCMKYAKAKGVCKAHGAQVKVKRCEVEGCHKQAQKMGKCFSHGARLACAVDGCGKVPRRRGMCGDHFTQQEAHRG